MWQKDYCSAESDHLQYSDGIGKFVVFMGMIFAPLARHEFATPYVSLLFKCAQKSLILTFIGTNKRVISHRIRDGFYLQDIQQAIIQTEL